MDSSIPIEIRGQYGEFYLGHIIRYNNPNSLVFRFAGESSLELPNEISVSPSCLRKTPKSNKQEINVDEIPSGQAVEVLVGTPEKNISLSCTTDKCLPSWWPAQVVKQRGDFVILDFPKNNKHDSEKNYVTHGLLFPYPSIENVAEKSQIRYPNTEKMLSSSDFYYHILEIPKDLVETFKERASMEHLIRICGQSMLICEVTSEIVLPAEYSNININDKSKSHFLIFCTSSEVIFKAKTLGQEIVKMLRQKVVIMHQISELSRKLRESQSQKSDSLIFEEFKVAPDLVGQSIGARGANISRARGLDGIVSVVLNPETCTFKVSGKTKESVESAKKVLEYATEVMQVPQEYVSRIIGQKNRHIQSLVDRVGLAKIRVQSAEEATVLNCVPFAFTGTRSAINDACLLIKFNIENLKEIDRLQESVIPYQHNRFTEGDGNHYRNERNGKPFGDGRMRPGGRRDFHKDSSDNATFNGDGNHTSEAEHYSDTPMSKYSVPFRRQHGARPLKSNTNQSHQSAPLHQKGNDTRQSCLPPPAPKSGDLHKKYNANGETLMEQQKPRGSEANMAQRMGRRQPSYIRANGDGGSQPRLAEKPSRENEDYLQQENVLQHNGIPINAAT